MGPQCSRASSRTRARHGPVVAALLLAAILSGEAGSAAASTAIVPDDFKTIQQAIDSGADTVLVREGNYPEVVQAYRGVALFGLGGTRPRLAGLMITNPFDGLSKAYTIRDLEFSGPDTIRTVNPHARLLDIAFTRCRLAQGLLHGSTDPNDIDRLVLSNCLIEGFFDARAASFEMHSDTSTAGVSCTFEGFVSVDSCWFRGGSRRALRLGASDNGFGTVVGNVFEDTPVGLYLTNCFQVSIQSNIVRRASAIGMELDGQYIQLSDNDISNCGVGLWRSFGTTTLINNRIIRTSNTGAYFYAPEVVQAERNTVGQCGGSAILVESPSSSNLRFAQNTFYKAAGSGILIVNGTSTTLTAEGNIVFGAAAWGLQVVSTELSATLGCNDWFANGLGAACGAALGATDVAVDPGFCDISQDDAHLNAGSPLLASVGCDTIGALGRGCDAPIIARLTTFTASATDGVEIRWQVADTAPGFVAWIERAEASAGPWAKVECERGRDGEVTVEYDRTTAPARSYWYRLVATDRGLTRALGEPIQVETAPPTRFALLGTGPNPSRGAVEATFQLAHAAEITLELFDAQGRRVATLARGSWPAGIHRANWAGAQPASGLYLVRYRHPGGEDLRRIAIVR